MASMPAGAEGAGPSRAGADVGHSRAPAAARDDEAADRAPEPAVRLADVADAPALVAIYAPWVRDTAVSLELEVPTARVMAQRVAATLPRWPWLVAEVDDRVVGYAYGGSHRGRPGYRWSVEVSAYVDAAAHGRGVGRRLYTVLVDLLAHQGHHLALAGIGVPNPASVGFHEALGFHHVGTFREVGQKFGAWHDVGWWQRSLAPDATPGSTGSTTCTGAPSSAAPPTEPRTLEQLDPTVVADLLG